MYTGSPFGIPDEDGFRPHCMKKYLLVRYFSRNHTSYVRSSCKFKMKGVFLNTNKTSFSLIFDF